MELVFRGSLPTFAASLGQVRLSVSIFMRRTVMIWKLGWRMRPIESVLLNSLRPTTLKRKKMKRCTFFKSIFDIKNEQPETEIKILIISKRSDFHGGQTRVEDVRDVATQSVCRNSPILKYLQPNSRSPVCRPCSNSIGPQPLLNQFLFSCLPFDKLSVTDRQLFQ